MSGRREAILIIASGKKGVGKTYQTIHAIGRYRRKVLIFDVNMEYTPQTIRESGCNFTINPLAIKDIPLFMRQTKIEARRILPITEKGTIANLDEMALMLFAILNDNTGFRSGMLILEDLNKYLVETRNKQIISAIATNRHKALDVIVHLQSLRALTPRMWANTQIVRMHNQMDNIAVYKSKIPNYEVFGLAQALVFYMCNEKNQPRFFCYVGNDDQYIRGDFSREDFRQAILNYIETEPFLISRKQKMGKGGIETIITELENKYIK